MPAVEESRMAAEDDHGGVCHKVPHATTNIQQQNASPCVCIGKVLNQKPETSVIDQKTLLNNWEGEKKTNFLPEWVGIQHVSI